MVYKLTNFHSINKKIYFVFFKVVLVFSRNKTKNVE